jgi:hypothetical protein
LQVQKSQKDNSIDATVNPYYGVLYLKSFSSKWYTIIILLGKSFSSNYLQVSE